MSACLMTEASITVSVSIRLSGFDPFIHQPAFHSRPILVEALRFSNRWGKDVTAEVIGHYAKKDGSASVTRARSFPPQLKADQTPNALWEAGIAALAMAQARVHVDAEADS